MNIFDIIGPLMVGPSSSHTAGAVKIGNMVRTLLAKEPVKIELGLHGSFAETGKGHGTDKALIAGIMGLKPDDMRIADSFQLAANKKVSLKINKTNIPGAHPNTARIRTCGSDGEWLEVEACSLGGGQIIINKIDGIDVNCTGENPTLIVHNLDQPGHVAEVTTMLAGMDINIAKLQLYRNRKGGYAVMVVETDQPVPDEELKWLAHMDGIIKVTYLKGDA